MNSEIVQEDRVFFSDETPRPLGRLTLAGTLKKSIGIGARHLRVYGRYAIVLLCAGQGYYRDLQGAKANVHPGDVIFVFPELPHSYGPSPTITQGGEWDEIYVCFDGPLFDLWRRESLIDHRHPIGHVADVNYTAQALLNLVSQPRPTQESEHIQQLSAFLSVLGHLTTAMASVKNEPEWLQRAKSALESNLHLDLSGEAVAHEAGLSYESFRKQFARETGVSPTRYRTRKRIQAAQILIERGDMTQSSIARALGFSDETHLSRRFREVTGVSPREFRRAERSKKQDPAS